MLGVSALGDPSRAQRCCEEKLRHTLSSHPRKILKKEEMNIFAIAFHCVFLKM